MKESMTDKKELKEQYKAIIYTTIKDKTIGEEIKKPVGMNCPQLAKLLMEADNHK